MHSVALGRWYERDGAMSDFETGFFCGVLGLFVAITVFGWILVRVIFPEDKNIKVLCEKCEGEIK